MTPRWWSSRSAPPRGYPKPPSAWPGPKGVIKVGLFRPITLFPYPGDALLSLSQRVKKFILQNIEMNTGQMVEDVKLSVARDADVHFYGHPRAPPVPEELLERGRDQRKCIEVPMKNKFLTRPQSLVDVNIHFCPGCHHGTIHRIVAEASTGSASGKRQSASRGSGVRSSCTSISTSTWSSRPTARPRGGDRRQARAARQVVFTYQGDGDLAAIGMSEIIHAANRGENITVIFVNNTMYGMTGGQMAPTTMLGQKTSTTPTDAISTETATRSGWRNSGRPRGDGLLRAGRGLHPCPDPQGERIGPEAFEMQIDGMGFSLVEFLSTCPTNWGMKPLEAQERVLGEMSEYYPLGVFKERNRRTSHDGRHHHGRVRRAGDPDGRATFWRSRRWKRGNT